MKLFKKSKKHKGNREPYKNHHNTIQIKKIFTKFEFNNDLNLDYVNLDDNQDDSIIISNIINKIIQDKNIFYLQKFDAFKNFLPKDDLYSIQRILIDNKFNYEAYPNDYVYCLISNHCYCFKFNFSTNNTKLTDNISGFSENYQKSKEETILTGNIIIQDDELHCDCVWKELFSRDWLIYSIFQTHGYKSITYLNENTKQIVVAYQGMRFKMEDLYIKDSKSYIQSLNDLIKNQESKMIENVNKFVELSNKLNYSLSFTGYSFGSIFAQLSVFLCHKYLNKTKVKAVVFESVGLYELFKELNNKTNNKIDLDDLDIITYVLYPSFFNTINKHIGKIISSYEYLKFEFPNRLESEDYYEIYFKQASSFKKFKNEITDFQIFKEYRETIFKKYEIFEAIGKFYLSGLKSLVSSNLKLLLLNINFKIIHLVNNWPSNYEFRVSNFPDFIKNILLIIFQKCRNIKKNMYSDLNIDITYDYDPYVYDKKELLCSNEVDNYLDKISQFRDVLDFQINVELNQVERIFNLQSKYEVFYKNHVKTIVTRNGVDVNKIVETFKHMTELDSNLKDLIDKKIHLRNKLIQKKQIHSQTEFCKLTNYLLEDYVDLNRHYKMDKSFTIITGECGCGKSTLAAKLVHDYIKFNKNTLVKWIDCSTIESMLQEFFDFENIRLYANENRRLIFCNFNYENNRYNYENFYLYLTNLIHYLHKKKLNVIFILDNLSRFHYLNILFKINDSYLKVIITSNNFKQEKQGKFFNQNYNLIKLDKLSENECNSILLNSKHLFDEFLSDTYDLNNFKNNLLKNEDDNRILFYKMHRLLNIFKRAKLKFKTINEIINCNQDILHYIQKDNKTAFKFLIYIAYYLDRNNLRVDLLKCIYRLINNYDLDFDLDESFNFDFNQDLEYLISLAIVTKINDTNYVIHDFVKMEIKNLEIIDIEDKLKVYFTNHLALNQLFRLTFFEEEKIKKTAKMFFKKHYYSISNKYRYEKLNKYFGKFDLFNIFCEKFTNRKKSSNILELTFDEVNNFIKEIKQNEFNKLSERKTLIKDELNELIADLNNGLDLIYEEISKLKNEIQLNLEENVIKSKENFSIERSFDENDLDPLEYENLLKEINNLKEKAYENLYLIEKYHKNCIDSFMKKRDEINSLDKELKHILEIIDYFFNLKNTSFSNLKLVNHLFNQLECKILNDKRRSIYEILFINESYWQSYKNNYFKIGNIHFRKFKKEQNKIGIDKSIFLNNSDLSEAESIKSFIRGDIDRYIDSLYENS